MTVFHYSRNHACLEDAIAAASSREGRSVADLFADYDSSELAISFTTGGRQLWGDKSTTDDGWQTREKNGRPNFWLQARLETVYIFDTGRHKG